MEPVEPAQQQSLAAAARHITRVELQRAFALLERKLELSQRDQRARRREIRFGAKLPRWRLVGKYHDVAGASELPGHLDAPLPLLLRRPKPGRLINPQRFPIGLL